MLAYLIPSALGENVVRLRYAALPIAVLTLSLRRWRPLPICVIAFGLAVAWNVSPLLWSLSASSNDPSAKAAYWQPVVGFLHHSLGPAYRVEVVGTANHWEAVYLPQAGIPIVRGWFRQDDFPQNEVLYDKLTRRVLPRVASRAQRALRRAHELGARLQREGRDRAAPERRLRAAGRLPHRRRDRLRGSLAAADRHRARATRASGR